MKRWTAILFFFAFSAQEGGGCDEPPAPKPPPPPPADPSSDELTKARHIDVERMVGRVAKLEVRYFKGDRPETKETKGRPYYCAAINTTAGSVEEFCGLEKHIYSALMETQTLPMKPMLDMAALAELHGKIMDKDRDLRTGNFYIAVDRRGAIAVFRVSAETFYRLDIGMWLPMGLPGLPRPEQAETQSAPAP